MSVTGRRIQCSVSKSSGEKNNKKNQHNPIMLRCNLLFYNGKPIEEPAWRASHEKIYFTQRAS